MIIASFLLSLLLAQSGSDTLYLTTGKQACVVKEVTERAVRYTYPNEDALYTMAIHNVQKIVFSSGRTQVFTPPASPNLLRWKDVKLTPFPADIEGLYCLGPVALTAKGITPWSGTLPVRKRAERKMQQWGALMGADVIYITDENVGARGLLRRAQTSIGGIAYARSVISLEAILAALNGRKSLVFTELSEFRNSFTGPETVDEYSSIQIDSLQVVDGRTRVFGKINKVSYTDICVSGIDSNFIYLSIQIDKAIYNVPCFIKEPSTIFMRGRKFSTN